MIESVDKSVECLVCGKQFPRGALDLLRHSKAITLQHLISKKYTSNFCHSCPYDCGLYFTKKEHLDLHTQSVCGSKAKAKRISIQYLTSTYDSFASKNYDSKDQVVVTRKRISKRSNDNNDNDVIDDNADSVDDNDNSTECNIRNVDNRKVGVLEADLERTLECMVCGKLFPRGLADLQRHTTGNNDDVHNIDSWTLMMIMIRNGDNDDSELMVVMIKML